MFIPLFLYKESWVRRVIQIALIISTGVWIHVLYKLINSRITAGLAWYRLGLIMSGVILLFIAAMLLLNHKDVKQYYNKNTESGYSSSGAFVLTGILLVVVKLKIEMQVLLVDRFFPGFGWIEVFLLSLYAAIITGKILQSKSAQRIRLIIWTMFSAVFFSQLLLGIYEMDKLLMTGKLHLQVPAMIIAGPIYRGNGLFMPILLLSTLLVVGPAWCSHLYPNFYTKLILTR